MADKMLMENMEQYDFGLRLKKLRRQKNYSQQVLANKLGLSKGTIYIYEHDTLTPPLEKAILLSQILDTSLDYLAGLEKHPTIDVSNLSEKQVAWLNYTINEFFKK